MRNAQCHLTSSFLNKELRREKTLYKIPKRQTHAHGHNITPVQYTVILFKNGKGAVAVLGISYGVAIKRKIRVPLPPNP
jgi:hypothetical protein